MQAAYLRPRSVGGIENPRLLLASTAWSKAGVGMPGTSSVDIFMDHPRRDGLAQADLRDCTIGH